MCLFGAFLLTSCDSASSRGHWNDRPSLSIAVKLGFNNVAIANVDKLSRFFFYDYVSSTTCLHLCPRVHCRWHAA